MQLAIIVLCISFDAFPYLHLGYLAVSSDQTFPYLSDTFVDRGKLLRLNCLVVQLRDRVKGYPRKFKLKDNYKVHYSMVMKQGTFYGFDASTVPIKTLA